MVRALLEILNKLLGLAIRTKEDRDANKFDKAIAEDDHAAMSDDLSDSFDSVRPQGRRDSRRQGDKTLPPSGGQGKY